MADLSFPTISTLLPSKIVALIYDMEYDDFVVIHADGQRTRMPYTEELGKLSSQYDAFFTKVNDIGGPFWDAWSAAVDKFLAWHG